MFSCIRIEHPLDGRGPWRSDALLKRSKILDRMFDRHATWSANGMPTPFSDNINTTRWVDWVCGYNSLDDFRKWVRKSEIKTLKKYGFKVLSIKVKQIERGDHQCIFPAKEIISKRNIINNLLK